MKILVINGSPHKGNTWRLTEIVMAQIKGLDKTVEFTDIHLSACNIPFCTGCSLCFRKGHRFCPHNQYIQPIMEKIEESDGVIFAASCFQGAVPALGKNFTDHLAFLIHRPRFFAKKALIISTTGGVSADCVTKSLVNTLAGWGFNKCYQLPVVALSWNDYKPTEKHIKKASKVAKAFYLDLKSKRLHPPRIGVLIPFNLFQAMSKDYAPGTPYETPDGVFWQQYMGLRYAPGVPVPLHKKIFGWLVFQVGKYLSPQMIVTYVDPGPKENIEFSRGKEAITIYQDEEVERGFCSICGTTLFWHNPADNHYCMNAELFDEIINKANFDLELFYDMKPAYYAFTGERKKLDRHFKEIKNE